MVNQSSQPLEEPESQINSLQKQKSVQDVAFNKRFDVEIVQNST